MIQSVHKMSLGRLFLRIRWYIRVTPFAVFAIRCRRLQVISMSHLNMSLFLLNLSDHDRGRCHGYSVLQEGIIRPHPRAVSAVRASARQNYRLV